jgi:dihydropyrimidine dehydrogenase (NAD+) subunit PreT
MIFKAIGQTYVDVLAGRWRWRAGASRSMPTAAPSVAGIWAGGDCVAGGKDLTVAAVDDGRRAAESINAFLRA